MPKNLTLPEGYESIMPVDSMWPADDSVEALIDWLRVQYPLGVHLLHDGTIVAMHDLMYTRSIMIDVDRIGWGKRFCFEDRELAVKEFNKLLTGDDEPVGYIARR